MARLNLVPRSVLLEVERKFCGLTTSCLTADAGFPNFRSLHNLGQQTLRDTYFDSGDRLSAQGIWIRKRRTSANAVRWEAKCRQGGTYNNSMFEELTDETAIAHCVQNVTGHAGTSSDQFGLDIMADMTTTRHSWLADGQFKIVLDSMDFGHEVGEVELERIVKPPPCQGMPFDACAWKRRVAKDMDAEVVTFMQTYSWAFQPGVPRGKLTAYFERRLP